GVAEESSRAVRYRQRYWVFWPFCWAVCVWVSRQPLEGRLARHEVSLPSPTASAGAQVGTLSATTSPFLATSERSSGNCTVWPKYGVSLTTGLEATVRENSRLPGCRSE